MVIVSPTDGVSSTTASVHATDALAERLPLVAVIVAFDADADAFLVTVTATPVVLAALMSAAEIEFVLNSKSALLDARVTALVKFSPLTVIVPLAAEPVALSRVSVDGVIVSDLATTLPERLMVLDVAPVLERVIVPAWEPVSD